MAPYVRRRNCSAMTCALLLCACTARDGSLPGNLALAGVSGTGMAEQRVNLDPETGELVPGTATTQQSVAPSSRSTSLASRDADEVHLPDGTVGVRVAHRFYHTISVCLQADGTFSSDCPPLAATATAAATVAAKL